LTLGQSVIIQGIKLKLGTVMFVPGENAAVIGWGNFGIHALRLFKIFGAGMIIAVDISASDLEGPKNVALI